MGNKSRRKRTHNDIAKTQQQISATSTEYHFSGPIPDPHTLRTYDELVPGAADRILKMAENQSTHRRELEKIAVKSGARNSLFGIICAFIIAVVTVTAGAYVIVNGQQWGGTILGSAGLVGLVGVFVYGTNSSRKERERNK